MKLLVVGRSACGKDTLAAILQNRYNMTFVKSHSTRPPRFEGEDTHVFVSPEEGRRLLPDAVTWTEINGKLYFAMRETVEANDAYIIDPKGLFELVKNMPDTVFAVAYLTADPAARKQASLGRVPEEEREAESKVFDARIKAEDAQFRDFELMLETGEGLPPNVGWSSIYKNDYTPDGLEKAAEDIAKALGRV